METKTHEISTLSIASLLNGDDRYVIPVYQRNYAWQEPEITQLIQDVIDYIPTESNGQDYFIGTLVAYEQKRGNELFFETIDGQQRVTTLTLLTSAIRRYYPQINLSWYKKINLEFESRRSSSETLQHIYMFGAAELSRSYVWNEAIVSGFELCRDILKKKLQENKVDIESFANYLFKRVKILRVTVPSDTDLNHYFEIMNNRGEQLEKHEILKSKFLEILNGLDPSEKQISIRVFNSVWEACSNMEKYIQYGFEKGQREKLFGRDDWNTFQPVDFFDICQKLKPSFEGIGERQEFTIDEILGHKKTHSGEQSTDTPPDRFNSVINFANFLLHVLRIYTRKDIPLDDKRLITTFEAEIKKATDKIKFATEFGFELLRAKFFFDKFIIKREFIGGVDKWSLKRLKWYKDDRVSYVNTFGAAEDEANDDNRSILMLLSMFHVSTPTLVYKHWLNAALLYVMDKGDFVDHKEYKSYLLALARSFVFDRFLKRGNPKDYYSIVFRTTGVVKRNVDDLALDRLVYGEGIDNIVFNYLDYLLWNIHKSDRQVGVFEFAFRSSVEHYYPRKPLPGYKQLNATALDSFGNLCLISHSKNSRLSNQPPIAKSSHYKKQPLDSVKQWVMMSKYDPIEWNELMIADHHKQMIDVLTTDLDSDFGTVNQAKVAALGDDKAIRWFNQYKNDDGDRSLLARAILSFGSIQISAGYEKYYLYDWDYIKTTQAFKAFCDYVRNENPESLSSLIKSHLLKNKTLQNEPLRFALVKYPEIWEYCEQGYYSIDGDFTFIHSRKKRTENSLVDLLILLIGNWLKTAYRTEVCYQETSVALDLDLNRAINVFEFCQLNEGKGELVISIEEGKLKCNLIPYRNASNSAYVQCLLEYGWQQDEQGYKRGNSSTLLMITEDYENDLNRAKEKLSSIIKNGLGIKL